MHSNLCSACLLQWIAHFSRTGCSFFSSAWHCTHKTRRREGKDRMQPWAGVSVGGKMASSCSFPSLGFGSMLLAHLSPPIHAFVPYLLTTAPLSVMRLSLPNSAITFWSSSIEKLLALTCWTPGLHLACLICCHTWLPSFPWYHTP